MPTPTAQERGGCCSFMSPGPASKDDKDVFPVGTHTYTKYTTYIHTYIHTYIYNQPDTQVTDSQGTHMNTDGMNSLIMPLSLAEQDRGPLVEIHICPCTRWIPAATGLRQPD